MKYRTHTCGELRIENKDQTVTLAGWLQNIRDKGTIMFITLRDQYGVTQGVIENPELQDIIRGISRESTISITGIVVERSDKNPEMPTGEIEIIPSEIKVLGECTEVLPFEILNSRETSEELRLTYRFLDLRNQRNHNNIVMRSKIIQYLRTQMTDLGFLEIQTPILTSSSPEGARDFIVPSRLHPGKFYALPQAPQQFKQLLMVSGFDRYFQIAPCFRDEDARADRSPGEFYQLDMEMAFATQEDVFEVAEKVIYNTFAEFTDAEVSPAPFTRITYKDAMEKYGSDKPDLRNPLIVEDFNQLFSNTEFPGFTGKNIRGILVSAEKSVPRKMLDKLTDKMKLEGASNLYYVKLDDSGAFATGISKHLSDTEKEALISKGMKPGDYAFFTAEPGDKAFKISGILRKELGELFELIQESCYKFCWIVDFPMFEPNEETGKIDFSHNPFSMPQIPLEKIDETDPLSILAYQYDIVCNGIELSSGAVRNHDPKMMRKLFGIAGYDESVILEKFPSMYKAFKYGAPPHAGIAPGVDRMIMLILNEPSIRDTVAFPMNKGAKDLLMNAPGPVTSQQLSDVHIAVKMPEPDKE